MRSKGLLAIAVSVLVLHPLPVAQGSTTPSPGAPSPAAVSGSAQANQVDVMAVRSLGDHIQLVAAVQPDSPVPLNGSAITVTAAGSRTSTRVTPVLSTQTPVELVVDASASGTASAHGGGLSGAAGLLLQLPPGLISGVVAARTPPQVLVRPGAGVTDDLQALSDLHSSGAPATSDALTVALRQLPAKPLARPVIVLYTAQPDAGDWTVPALVLRMQQANAVLAVVTTSSSPFWRQVTAATGGLAVYTQPPRQISASDQLADALHARYSVTFPQPPGTQQATISVTTPGGHAITQFTLPKQSTAQPREGATSWRWAAAFLVFAVIAAVVLMGFLLRRRAVRGQTALGQEVDLGGNYHGAEALVWSEPDWRGPTEEQAARSELSIPVPSNGTPSAESGESAPERAQEHTGEAADGESTGPIPGVRVFDVTSSVAPLDITNSLFEPRSVRDAREREEAGRRPADDTSGPRSNRSKRPPAR